MQTLSDVRAQAVSWLWPRRIARGKLGLIAGEPGEGKSTLLLDLAARLTRPGALMPDGAPAPDGAVLLLSAEDGLSDTIRPRLDASGADVRHVHALTATRDLDGTERHLELGRDLPQLEAAIERYTPALVIIDPLSAYLGHTDTWRDNEVRALLSPLASLAEDRNCAILGVLHLTKNAAARVLHRIMGSIGFVAAARVVLAVARDPDDETRRLLLPIKNNLSPPADTLAFTLDNGRLLWDDRPVDGVTADSVLGESPADRGERQDAEEFLREMLVDGEPMRAVDVFRSGKANGIAERTLKRAKGRMGVKSKLVGFGREGHWRWWLPLSGAAVSRARVDADTVAPSVAKDPKPPMKTQRVPEGANPLVRGPLCDVRGGQERAILKVAPSVETPIKHTESAEGANPASPHVRARETAQGEPDEVLI